MHPEALARLREYGHFIFHNRCRGSCAGSGKQQLSSQSASTATLDAWSLSSPGWRNSRAKVKVDAETGRMSIKPSKPVSTKDMKPGVTKFIGGGYLFLPKKCDLSKQPTVRHEGPVGQLLVIDFPKLPQYCTERKDIVHC